MLPCSSSDYGERDGQPLNAPISILLRVGFTGTQAVSGLPVGSYPTFPSLPRLARRFISVALSLKSPSPDVIRHPCPVELGLSSPIIIGAVTWLTQNKYCFFAFLSGFLQFRGRPHSCRDMSRRSGNSCLACRGPAPVAARTDRPVRLPLVATELGLSSPHFHTARSLGLLKKTLSFGLFAAEYPCAVLALYNRGAR